MKITKHEQGLGGGEGSVIHYYFDCGNKSVLLASSRYIKFNNPERNWVKDLDFLDDFELFEELKELLEECQDSRLTEYILKGLAE